MSNLSFAIIAVVISCALAQFPVRQQFNPHINRLQLQQFAGVTGEGHARILSQQNEPATADGFYQYSYDTENGIHADEINRPRVLQRDHETFIVNTVQGSYAYTAPNGEKIAVSYTADENGFHPQLHGEIATRRN